MNKAVKIEFESYSLSIPKILDQLDFEEKLKGLDKILLKPNLLENSGPPCTTDVICVEAVVKYILERRSGMDIVVLEGSGGCSTGEAYDSLGYTEMEKKYDIKLMDVDESRIIKLKNEDALVYKEIYLPEVIFDRFFISMPVLKDHLITTVTLGLKNLVGLLHKKHYGSYWSYNRSDVHRVGVHDAVVDLNTYVDIDMNLIDGRLGQEGSHMAGGRHCSPSKNMIICGYDALEADKTGTEVLGHDWEDIRHLKILDEKRRTL